MTDDQQPRTYPEGVPSWLDYETADADADAVADFYGGLLGWTLTDAMPAGAPGHYLIASLDGRDAAALASGAAALGGPAFWNTYIAVDDADATAAAVAEAGGEVLAAPSGNPGGRAAICRDPQGAVFRLWQAGRRLGAQVANRPGAWNFSDLRTTDPDAALAFYSRVFPWTLQDMGADAGAFLRVPGYGDHLAATVDPDIHERQQGMPDGFADAIGAVQRTNPGEPAHWHVTFSVADRDGAADEAQRRGGTVYVRGETPWQRFAIVSDPWGAPFTLGQYTG